MRERVLRGGTNRFLIVRERRKGEEGIAKADLGAPQRRQQVIFCIELGEYLGDGAAVQRNLTDVVLASIAEFLEPERIGRVRVAQEIVAISVEKQFFHVSTIEPPQAAFEVQQHRNEPSAGRWLVATA